MKETLFRLKNTIENIYKEKDFNNEKIFPIVLDYFTESLITSSPYKFITYDLDGKNILFYRNKFPFPIDESDPSYESFVYYNPIDNSKISVKEWNRKCEELNFPISLKLFIDKDKDDPYICIITWHNPSILFNAIEVELQVLLEYSINLYELINHNINNMERKNASFEFAPIYDIKDEHKMLFKQIPTFEKM